MNSENWKFEADLIWVKSGLNLSMRCIITCDAFRFHSEKWKLFWIYKFDTESN